MDNKNKSEKGNTPFERTFEFRALNIIYFY